MTYREAALYRPTETDVLILLEALTKCPPTDITDEDIRAQLDAHTNTEIGASLGVSRKRVARVRRESG